MSHVAVIARAEPSSNASFEVLPHVELCVEDADFAVSARGNATLYHVVQENLDTLYGAAEPVVARLIEEYLVSLRFLLVRQVQDRASSFAFMQNDVHKADSRLQRKRCEGPARSSTRQGAEPHAAKPIRHL
jgi:hypothetical protein